MTIKNYLPFRYSREGCIPDRMVLRPCNEGAEACINTLTDRKKTAHFHLGTDGTVTALTPISGAANLLGPTGNDPNPSANDLPMGRRGILILVEGEVLSEQQTEALIRLLRRIQQEVFRIYGDPFPFSRRNLICDPTFFPVEKLLEDALFQPDDTPRFRVQTGSYRHRRDAEARVEALTQAGIAAYITEVREA